MALLKSCVLLASKMESLFDCVTELVGSACVGGLTSSFPEPGKSFISTNLGVVRVNNSLYLHIVPPRAYVGMVSPSIMWSTTRLSLSHTLGQFIT